MARVEKIVQPTPGSHIWLDLMKTNQNKNPKEKQSQKTGCLILLLNITHIGPTHLRILQICKTASESYTFKQLMPRIKILISHYLLQMLLHSINHDYILILGHNG